MLSSTTPKPTRKRVLVVGAGAAGMSCAHHLAQHPDKFSITLIDSADHCGGQAFSIPLDKEKHGASWLNQGVQGGSFIFHHTMTMFARMGYHADPVKLQGSSAVFVSFGKGSTSWNNVYPTSLLARHQPSIRRFKTTISILRYLEFFILLLPIKYLLSLLLFPAEFTNAVVYPMVALFLGTGNYTPEVPSIILERLCTSPTYGMWYPLDEKSVATNLPPMVVFPRLGDFYEEWRKRLVGRGVSVRLETELKSVVRRDESGVVVRLVQRKSGADERDTKSSFEAEEQEVEEHYDELVLCVLADTANRILQPTSTRLSRFVLGSAKFADDLTITHTDSTYMQTHYEPLYNASIAAPTLSGEDQTPRLQSAQKTFKPMYLTKSYASSPSKLELSFNCTHYQSQFPPHIPSQNHIFQTIFLNRARDSHLWTLPSISPEKIIRRDHWHQLCHSWTHYALVVPWLQLLQGRKRTRFAGAWTLLNAHEVAVISGIAAAVDLGAEYPRDLERDGFALMCFRAYYLLGYGKWYWRKHGKGEGEGREWGRGVGGSVYCGPGVSGWRGEDGEGEGGG